TNYPFPERARLGRPALRFTAHRSPSSFAGLLRRGFARVPSMGALRRAPLAGLRQGPSPFVRAFSQSFFAGRRSPSPFARSPSRRIVPGRGSPRLSAGRPSRDAVRPSPFAELLCGTPFAGRRSSEPFRRTPFAGRRSSEPFRRASLLRSFEDALRRAFRRASL